MSSSRRRDPRHRPQQDYSERARAARKQIQKNRDSIREALIERDEERCRWCGAAPTTGAVLQINHTVPLLAGGSNALSNLLLLCRECQQDKYDQDIMEGRYPPSSRKSSRNRKRSRNSTKLQNRAKASPPVDPYGGRSGRAVIVSSGRDRPAKKA